MQIDENQIKGEKLGRWRKKRINLKEKEMERQKTTAKRREKVERIKPLRRTNDRVEKEKRWREGRKGDEEKSANKMRPC